MEINDPLGWAPISQLIGLEIESDSGVGRARVWLDVDQRMHNPMGFVHGGVLALLADAALGIAFGRTLDDQHGFATIEMKVNFIRPIKQGRLCAEAALVTRGLRIGFVEARITDQRQKLIATANASCTVNTIA